MRNLGYTYREELIWVKKTKNDNLVNGNGYIFRHSHEAMLVFSKGRVNCDIAISKASGTII